MNKQKKVLLLISVLLMFGGCVTTLTSTDDSTRPLKDKQYYVNKARNAIEKYRVTDRNEFYGFTLGGKFEGREKYAFSPDEKTGGNIYSLKDPKGVFDTVGICTDEVGKILRIGLIKRFNSYLDGQDFFRTIEEKLKTVYPVKVRAYEKDWFIEIYVAKDDNNWIEKYSEYLEQKDESLAKRMFDDTFSYILHPTLAKIKCALVETEGKAVFLLEYIGKEYVRRKELQEQKLKEKLGEL